MSAYLFADEVPGLEDAEAQLDPGTFPSNHLNNSRYKSWTLGQPAQQLDPRINCKTAGVRSLNLWSPAQVCIRDEACYQPTSTQQQVLERETQGQQTQQQVYSRS